ncbi:SagB/ThcOx family dehydrogenase [Clostridium tunisiense]|uniref:SagB/ThcOx family dehydrogenase n=1 Tax=Clostridium tunisiense TaxID=219748 RepID=UPI0002E8C822|nr:SagB/ThcOx family dehydrogenase [Clostridium tunisiense]
MGGNNNYYWSPSTIWYLDDDTTLVVGKLRITGNVVTIFPDFYYKACRGLSLHGALREFSYIKKDIMRKFWSFLIQNNILINQIQEVDNLFNYQYKVWAGNSEFSRLNVGNIKTVLEHMNKGVMRNPVGEDSLLGINLLKNPNNILNAIKERKTNRLFNKREPISMEVFSSLFEVLSYRSRVEYATSYYPSAGALYPIDSYIYVKEKRVEGLNEGLYYYHPFSHKILMIDEKCNIRDAHYEGNKHTYDESAISIFFVFDSDISMPKYLDRGYYYAIIDVGIMCQTLAIHAETLGLSTCIIGNLNFDRISTHFKLKGKQKYLLGMECGIKLTI